MKESIICAANYYNDYMIHAQQPKNVTIGFVICGLRHCNCISSFTLIVGFPYTKEGHILHKTEVQGFITNTHRFVNRQEAYTIAFDNNQIIGPNKGYSTNSIGLTSEDLY